MVGAHLVLVDRVVDEHDGCAVAVDDVAGAQIAANHLLSLPGTGITFVNGPISIPQCRDRRRGLYEALPDSTAQTVEFTSPHMTVDEGVAIGRRIADNDAPRRIFCANDQLALASSAGCESAGSPLRATPWSSATGI